MKIIMCIKREVMNLKSVNFICVIFVYLFLSGNCYAHSDGHSYSFIHTDRNSKVELTQPSDEESFTFAIFGDRTGGPQSGLMILDKAVTEINTIMPDLVMMVGDLVQGYNQRPEWIKQMTEFKSIMNKLNIPWFPVAGNHDVYWRGEGRPENEHDGDYEEHFGPLWYAFQHKDCWFIVLYSDEGNFETGEKNFKKAGCQKMSDSQIAFLKKSLVLAKEAKHVFVFLHHPRWTGGNYGNDWDRVHKILTDAGNVSACFAGHTHRMKFDGKKDNIEYHTLATTGGALPAETENILQGRFHHYDLVTVRGDKFYVAAIPIGNVIDPKSDRTSHTIKTEEKWCVKNDETRTLIYPINIPAFDGTSAILRIGVSDAYDNAGDKGAVYELRSSDNKIIQRGFLSSRGYEWITHPVIPSKNLIFLLKDEDTVFDGDHPGNGGRIKIEMDVIKCSNR